MDPLLPDSFLYSYKAESTVFALDGKQLTSRLNSTYIADVLPINNPEFENYLGKMNPFELEEKKEEIWLSPMTKAPTPTEMSKGQSDNTNNATKKFD